MKNTVNQKIIWLVLTLVLLASTYSPALGGSVEHISARTAAALIEEYKSNPDFVILDIRTPKEFDGGHIANARMIDFYASSFATEFRSLDRNKTYLIYCRSGNRSGQLMKAVEKMDFKTVYNMKSGIVDWVGQGFKLIPTN